LQRAALFALAIGLATFSLLPVFGETVPPSPPAVSITITPDVAGVNAPRNIEIGNLAPSAQITVLLIDPAGRQTSHGLTSMSAGIVHTWLSPPAGGWTEGLYRVVVDLGLGRAMSGTFAAGDGQPTLSELTVLPSPWSALYFVATGLPPDQDQHLIVDLTGERGTKDIVAHADGNGTLTAFLWPQQLNLPFFESGYYEAEIPALHLKARFGVRERPGGSSISTSDVVEPGSSTPIHFQVYQANHLLWCVYARSDGAVEGEFLTPATNAGGVLNTVVTFPSLPPGSYLLATPYDWGETSFTINPPPPTETPTPTATPTSTPDPPKPPARKVKCTAKQKKAKSKRCKRKAGKA